MVPTGAAKAGCSRLANATSYYKLFSASRRKRLAETTTHTGGSGGGGRPPLPYIVMTEPLCCHNTHNKPQSIAGCMLRNHSIPKIASIASGTTQKLRVCTIPSAKVIHAACAKPRLANVLPSAGQTLSFHILSMGSCAATTTFSLRKLWLAPLSIKVNPWETGPLLLPD